MSTPEYVLNGVAWSLGGVVVTLTYQKIANWYRQRNDRGELPPISTTAYFGSLLVLFAIISTLIGFSNQVAQDRDRSCQGKINENNVMVANQRQAALIELAREGRDALKNANSNSQRLLTINAFDKYLTQATDSGVSVPVTSCRDGVAPPNLDDNSTSPSPSPTK